jgi:hypothetical protein
VGALQCASLAGPLLLGCLTDRRGASWKGPMFWGYPACSKGPSCTQVPPVAWCGHSCFPGLRRGYRCMGIPICRAVALCAARGACKGQPGVLCRTRPQRPGLQGACSGAGTRQPWGSSGVSHTVQAYITQCKSTL